MMKEFDFMGYIRVDHIDSIDTLGIVNTLKKDLSVFRFALSELLAHYDELACSIHNGSMVMESLAHVYASLNAFRIEVIAVGATEELIEVITDELATVFAQLVTYRKGNTVEFSKLPNKLIREMEDK